MSIDASVFESGVAAHEAAPPAERRAHRRLPASALRGLKSARVKYGPEITIIDLSPGGVLFETNSALTPNASIVLEFASHTSTMVVPARLLRCHDVSTLTRLRYEAACAFRRLLTLDDFTASDRRPANATASPAAWQRVIARFRDARLMHGYTNDFHPSKPYLTLSTSPVAAAALFTQLAQLEALYLLRGARDAQAPATITHGRKIEVTLPNGDVIVGSTLNYRPDGNGFFVQPADPGSEHLRVFVTPAGIRHLRFL